METSSPYSAKVVGEVIKAKEKIRKERTIAVAFLLLFFISNTRLMIQNITQNYSTVISLTYSFLTISGDSSVSFSPLINIFSKFRLIIFLSSFHPFKKI